MSDSPSKLPEADYPEDDLGKDPKAAQNAEKLRRMALEVLARWHWMIFFAILGALGAAYYLSKAPKLYRSVSTLLIKEQTASVMRQDQVEEIDLRTAQALQTVAERIRGCLRSGDDLAARIGGDELLVVLHGVRDLDDAVAVAEKLRRRTAEPIHTAAGPISVTLSIGVTLAHPSESTDALLARADAAMYQAKNGGRNQVVGQRS